MNQFANIGSMFPGAGFKNLRDNAKLALTLPGQPEIVGLIIKNALDDITVVEKDRIKVIHRDQVETIDESKERDRARGIAQAEYEYWKKMCDNDPDSHGLEGMGAAANILFHVVSGLSVEAVRARIGERGDSDYHASCNCFCVGDEEKFDAKAVLAKKFDNMLKAEVKRHGGIPRLSTEELDFREAMSAFLEGGAL